MSEFEKEISPEVVKQDLTHENDLPEWFCLIQTNRDYYIKRYKEQQQGKNKINFATFFSLYFMVPFQLLYRKFFIRPMFIQLIFFVFCFFVFGVFLAGFYLFVIRIGLSIDHLKNFGIAFVLLSIFLMFLSPFFISKKYNAWYFKSVKRKYEEGYRPSFYKDTSLPVKYVVGLTILGSLLIFLYTIYSSFDFMFIRVIYGLINAFTFSYFFFNSIICVAALWIFIKDRITLKRHLRDLKNSAD
ncbi:MAG: hypothetical protein NEHIOOID_00832 [Holosporales bacterium]